MVWGRNKGCAFVTDDCILRTSPHTPVASEFCNDGAKRGCTADLLAGAVCNLATYSSALPAAFRYFDDPKSGGTRSSADYCPYFFGYDNRMCEDSTLQPGENFRAEEYGAGARCVRSGLSQINAENEYIADSGGTSCHPVRCAAGGSYLEV